MSRRRPDAAVLLTALLLATNPTGSSSLSKVLVPSVFREWYDANNTLHAPSWVSNSSLHERYNYTVFLYQKVNSSAPNYIATNRGRENGVYYRYIVDHYHDFPDVAIFTHADPVEHQPHFLDWIGCINPNASYISINHHRYYRSTNYWHKYELWIEQCWRDVLRVVWNINGTDELNRLVPVDRPISVSFYCCQQFIISREMVQRRPLSVWQQLLAILGEAPECHAGDPDYKNLYAFSKGSRQIGPEPSLLPDTEFSSSPGTGRLTQAVTSEHLSHVIFGHQDLDMQWPDMKTICQHFLASSECPGSPCLL